AAIEHEDLEGCDAVIANKVLHLIDMRRFDRRNVIAVIDPEAPARLLEHFGHEIVIGAAAVQIIMAGPYVDEAGRDTAHGRGLALRSSVFSERRIDADMQMGVYTAREREMVFAVKNLNGLIDRDIGGKPADLAILDGDVETVDRGFLRPHNA